MRTGIAPILAALALSWGVPSQGQDPLETVSFAYYDVSGHDEASIRAAMDRERPVDPTDHRHYDALTAWQVHWRWDGDGQGGCDLSTTRTSASIVVTFPRLDPEGVPPPVLVAWTRFESGLRAHEMQHVQNVIDHLGEVDQTLRSATCETANAQGEAVLERIRAFDRALDAQTRHGRRRDGRFAD